MDYKTLKCVRNITWFVNEMLQLSPVRNVINLYLVLSEYESVFAKVLFENSVTTFYSMIGHQRTL